MLVASALNPKPGWRVLDLCAAPGGKTTHLAELMNDQGHIVACDRDAKRLEPLKATITRLGLKSVEVVAIADDAEPPAGPFDAALVDVPCSNTGVLGRRPEARWRLSEKEIARMAPMQLNLLTTAASRVKPGGVIVYSTCSVEPEENGKVVTAALQSSNLILEADQASKPGLPADGGYWARLRKS
jgi:16S rRNA (cytosine967-C5)-methyltransferase